MSVLSILVASIVVGVVVGAAMFIIKAEMCDGRTEVSWCL